MARDLVCPKCNNSTGNDWSDCGEKCPMPASPHYDREATLEAENAALKARVSQLEEALERVRDIEWEDGDEGGAALSMQLIALQALNESQRHD